MSSNILQRVRQIRFGDQAGTAFTVEVDGRQYLITARHLADASSDSGTVQLRHEEDWLRVPARRLEVLPKEADIAVFAPAVQITPAQEILLGGLVTVSQEMFFVGYPFGISSSGTALNAGYPFPFVKHALCSAFSSEAGFMEIFLDGLNNPGFSGGPVVSMSTAGAQHPPKILGVISRYRFDEVPVLRAGKQTDMSLRTNSGIILATSIRPALDAIKKNPIGAQLRSPASNGKN